MNNGQGNDHPLNRQIGFRVADTVTPDVHARNQAQIQMFRNYVDDMERRNQSALNRWYSLQERELQERVEAGRQAERMLSQLKNQRSHSPMVSATPSHASNYHSIAGNSHASQAVPLAGVPSPPPQNFGTDYNSGSGPVPQGSSYMNGVQVSYQQMATQHNTPYQTAANSYMQPQATTIPISRSYHREHTSGVPASNGCSQHPGQHTSYQPQMQSQPQGHASIPSSAPTSSSRYPNHPTPIAVPHVTRNSRPQTSISSQPVNSAHENGVSASSSTSQQTSDNPDPTLLAQQVVDFCELLKAEVQDEIVARLMSKMHSTFKPPVRTAPLDAHTENQITLVITQMRNKFQSHPTSFVIQAAQHLQRPPYKLATPGQIVAKVIIQQYLYNLGLSAKIAQPTTNSAPSTSVQTSSLPRPSQPPNPVISLQEVQPPASQVVTVQQPSPDVPQPASTTPLFTQQSPSQPTQRPTPLTPAKADKKTLARDILRSLRNKATAKPTTSPQSIAQSEDLGVKRKRADSGNSVSTADLPDKKPRIFDRPSPAQSLAQNHASTSTAHNQIPQSSQDVGLTTPPPATIQLPVASPELLGEIKTAGVLDMEMDRDIPRAADPPLDLLHFDQTPHNPESDYQTMDADDHVHGEDHPHPHPESHHSGPPSSGWVSPLMADTMLEEDIPFDTPSSPQQAPHSSGMPLFLPSDDDEDNSESKPTGLDLGPQHDHFVLDSSLLPPGTPQAVSQVKNPHRVALSEDDLNVPNISRAASLTRERSHALVSPKRSRSPKIFMSHVELPPPPRRRKRKTSSAGSFSEAEVDTTLDDANAGSEPDKRTWTRQVGSRLENSPCYWYGCNAELESLVKLVRHVVLHTQETLETCTYRCQWSGCADQFPTYAELLQHVKRHAAYPIFCPYQDCHSSFTSSKILVAHIRSTRQHRESPILRPEASLLQPDLTRELPQLPEIMLSYRSVPRQIKKPLLEPDHHYKLGAKVLANILCYVQPGRSRQTAPLRSTRQVPTTSIGVLENVLRQDPDGAKRFIQERIEEQTLRSNTRTGPALCDNMPSEWVTRLVLEKGIVFEDPNAPELVLSDDEGSVFAADTGDAGLIDGTSQPDDDANAKATGEAVLEETPSREPGYSQQHGSPSGSGGQGNDDAERQVSTMQ